MGTKLLALEWVGRVPSVTPVHEKLWIIWMVDWVVVDKGIRSWQDYFVQIYTVIYLVTATHLSSFARTRPITEAFRNFPNDLQFAATAAEASVRTGSSETVVLGQTSLLAEIVCEC